MFSIYTCQMNSGLSETWNLSYLSMNWKPILFNLNGSPQVGSNQMGYLSPTWMVKPKIGHPKCGHPKWDHPKWVNPKLTIPRGLHIFGCRPQEGYPNCDSPTGAIENIRIPPRPSLSILAKPIPFTQWQHSVAQHLFWKRMQAGMNSHDTVTFYLHLSKN